MEKTDTPKVEAEGSARTPEVMVGKSPSDHLQQLQKRVFRPRRDLNTFEQSHCNLLMASKGVHTVTEGFMPICHVELSLFHWMVLDHCGIGRHFSNFNTEQFLLPFTMAENHLLRATLARTQP